MVVDVDLGLVHLNSILKLITMVLRAVIKVVIAEFKQMTRKSKLRQTNSFRKLQKLSKRMLEHSRRVRLNKR